MEDDDETPNRSRSVAWFIAVCIGLPILYFLSTGPVALIVDRHPGLPGSAVAVAQVIYAPVIWLDRHVHVFHRLLYFYLNLWGVS